MLKRNRYPLHGQYNTKKKTDELHGKNNTKKTTAVLRTKTIRRGKKLGRWGGKKGSKQKEKEKIKKRKDHTAGHYCHFRAPPVELDENKQNGDYYSLSGAEGYSTRST